MDFSINLYAPSLFSCVVAAFFAFFILFRNYRLRFNAILGVLSIVASIWFFFLYLYLSDLNEGFGLHLYVISLAAILAYFSLFLIHRQDLSVKVLERFFPSRLDPLIAFTSLLMGVEIAFIGISLFSQGLVSSVFSDENLYAVIFPLARTTILIFSAAVLLESLILAIISVISVFIILKKHQTRVVLTYYLSFFISITWLIFSFSLLFFVLGILAGTPLSENMIRIPAISFLILLLLQVLSVTRYYYLSFKVLVTQIIGTLIVMFNLISIINSGGTEEIVLRTILIIVLAFLSQLLVKSVVGEIQKRKRIQETTLAIYSANKTLHKLDRAKSDFIASASHQLRSPLSVVKGIGSMLLDGTYGKISAPIKDALEKVYISNERLIGLIEDLLDVSHLEEGRVDFNFEKINLNDLAKKAADGLILQAKNKKLYLKFSPWRKSNLLVWADQQKVTEAVSNLVDNAIKYTRKGGVTVEVRKVSNNMRISVKDTGIGLKKEEITHLFQKFVRAGRGNKMSTVGTGLGLYVVRKMIEAHKGKIWAESAGEGRGSSFIIELPLGMKNPPDKKYIQRTVMEKKPA